jgi:hypothetical protein
MKYYQTIEKLLTIDISTDGKEATISTHKTPEIEGTWRKLTQLTA